MDASAVLALLHHEPGSQQIGLLLPDSAISTVNASEVISKLIDRRVPGEQATTVFKRLRIPIMPFEEDHAQRAGLLRQVTRSAGLSLGDRACLATAAATQATAVTTDRAWTTLNVSVQILLAR